MNREYEEKLSDLLGELDGDLLDTAMAVDTPEKLAKFQASRKQTRPVWLRATAAAACLALLLGVFLIRDNAPGSGVPTETPPAGTHTPGKEPSDPIQAAPPQTNLDGSDLQIQSMDMVNYYGAMYLLSQQGSAVPTAFGDGEYKVTLLNNTQPPQIMVPIPDNTEPPEEQIILPPADPYETQPPKNTEPYPYETQGPPPTGPEIFTQPIDPEDYLVYYEFDPETPVFVTKVYFFQIDLPEGTYLAQKIGAGLVDVVISDAVWGEYMVTFKNGDRYFSCLTNGHAPQYFEFSTHKYIEGYNVVKNGRQVNTYFVMEMGAGDQAVQIEEAYSGKLFPIVSQTEVAEVNASYTIAELEAYFNDTTEF